MNKEFEKVVCNSCGADDYEYISNSGQFDLPLNVVICKNCGLAYLNPRWTKETYLQFYTHEYDYYYRPGIQVSSVDTKSLNIIFERLSEKGYLEKPPKKMLDVGSGAGGNLLYFQSKFPHCQYYAIEPSDQATKVLTKNNIQIISKDVDSEWHVNHQGQFDLIIMRHVLEHFSDPSAALKKVAATLKEDGLLYIAVPNCLTPTTPLLSNWFRVVHTYYYNKYSLNNILINSGLEGIELIEGDKYKFGELIAIVKKQKNASTPYYDPSVYEKQKKVFQDRIAKEQKLFPSLKRQWKRTSRKIRRLINIK